MSKKPIFKLKSNFKPAGDQPAAIDALVGNLGNKSLLLGVTGSGKTFTLANVISKQNAPVLIISPNKTLAAQLYEEFCSFFPENKVCYFVSYYDYFMPESYSPSTDTYVAKEIKINPEIDRMRMDATVSVINRPDTIVIASVSAIYSLGNPVDYKSMTFPIFLGMKIGRLDFCKKLVELQYFRSDSLAPGSFRVDGQTLTIDLLYIRDGLRVDIIDDKICKIWLFDKKNYTNLGVMDNFLIFPSKHFVVDDVRKKEALLKIKADLNDELKKTEDEVVRQRLYSRVSSDISMIELAGYCSGIENYSVYFDGRTRGERPYCLLDFFPKDFLLILDESHIAVPQLGAMYFGDRSRKKNLVDFGFRMSSAYENRPQKFEEVEQFFNNTIFVSATPGPYEREHNCLVVEQIVRPTGIVDPEIFIYPREGQVDRLKKNIKEAISKGFRTLITVLTKKSAEQMALYLEEEGLAVCYLHSEIKTQQRTELLSKLRQGEFDVLVGINLLREGLDLPEVGLVAILDADIESFLRDPRSLIQTIGRAARNTESKVIFFADQMTGSMKKAIEETNRRREIQIKYNQTHGILPKTTVRQVSKSILTGLLKTDSPKKNGLKNKDLGSSVKDQINASSKLDQARLEKRISSLEKKMMTAAKNKEFEIAIACREEILKLKSQLKKES